MRLRNLTPRSAFARGAHAIGGAICSIPVPNFIDELDQQLVDDSSAHDARRTARIFRWRERPARRVAWSLLFTC